MKTVIALICGFVAVTTSAGNAFADTYMTATKNPVIYRATKDIPSDIVSYGTFYGQLAAWEIANKNNEIFLNYSRFAYGQGAGSDLVCYTIVGKNKFVGLGDSQDELKRAMVVVINDISKKQADPKCESYKQLVSEIPAAKTVSGLLDAMK
jgi:hypothetical protein